MLNKNQWENLRKKKQSIVTFKIAQGLNIAFLFVGLIGIVAYGSPVIKKNADDSMELSTLKLPDILNKQTFEFKSKSHYEWIKAASLVLGSSITEKMNTQLSDCKKSNQHHQNKAELPTFQMLSNAFPVVFICDQGHLWLVDLAASAGPGLSVINIEKSKIETEKKESTTFPFEFKLFMLPLSDPWLKQEQIQVDLVADLKDLNQKIQNGQGGAANNKPTGANKSNVAHRLKKVVFKSGQTPRFLGHELYDPKVVSLAAILPPHFQKNEHSADFDAQFFSPSTSLKLLRQVKELAVQNTDQNEVSRSNLWISKQEKQEKLVKQEDLKWEMQFGPHKVRDLKENDRILIENKLKKMALIPEFGNLNSTLETLGLLGIGVDLLGKTILFESDRILKSSNNLNKKADESQVQAFFEKVALINSQLKAVSQRIQFFTNWKNLEEFNHAKFDKESVTFQYQSMMKDLKQALGELPEINQENGINKYFNELVGEVGSLLNDLSPQTNAKTSSGPLKKPTTRKKTRGVKKAKNAVNAHKADSKTATAPTTRKNSTLVRKEK